MIGRPNQIAIAVPGHDAATATYRDTLGGAVSHPLGRELPIAAGVRVLGDGKLKIGARGKLVLFLHSKDFFGTLVELEEA